MKKILKSKKGFTLIELIVVIVILAILIAALTPAILGVIRRANRAADEADARSVMMAGSIAGISQAVPGIPDPADILAELTGARNVRNGTYTVFFEDSVGVGARYNSGFRSPAGTVITIGDTTSPGLITRTVTKTG